MRETKRKPETKTELLEKLAALEHEQWASWIDYQIRFGDIPKEYWRRKYDLAQTSYEKLTEEQKEQDRVWTRKVLRVSEAELTLLRKGLTEKDTEIEKLIEQRNLESGCVEKERKWLEKLQDENDAMFKAHNEYVELVKDLKEHHTVVVADLEERLEAIKQHLEQMPKENQSIYWTSICDDEIQDEFISHKFFTDLQKWYQELGVLLAHDEKTVPIGDCGDKEILKVEPKEGDIK